MGGGVSERLDEPFARAWRSTLPTGSAWHIVKALDPEPKRTEILPFAALDEVEAVSAELNKHYRAIPIVGCLTRLRPYELFGLERRHPGGAGRVPRY